MRKILIVSVLVAITSMTSAQKYVKFYNQGIEFFKQGKYKEADSLLSLAINKWPKGYSDRNMYFDRGITRLCLTDTFGFCSDMKSAADLNDYEARANYKKFCIKFDEEANEYYNQAYHEFALKNYKASDSLLTLSIMTYEFADNVFLRGKVRLCMLDTNGFCSDMAKISNINEKANKNYQQMCKSDKPTYKSIEDVQQECTNDDDNDVFFVVENMPKFNGNSSDDFRIFIQQNLRYPAEAQMNGIKGRVFVQFDICKNGEVKNVKIVRSAGEILDKEVLRVISLSPKWSPGLQHNKPVTVRFTFPVVFQL